MRQSPKKKSQINNLHSVCADGTIDELRSVLKTSDCQGLNLQLNVFAGITPLTITCMIKDYAKVKELLAQPGLQVNLPAEESGDTPLLACLKPLSSDSEMSKVLHGGDEEKLEIVKLLLKQRETDINLANKRGVTPLLYALIQTDPRITRMLLVDSRIKIDLESDILNSKGKTQSFMSKVLIYLGGEYPAELKDKSRLFGDTELLQLPIAAIAEMLTEEIIFLLGGLESQAVMMPGESTAIAPLCPTNLQIASKLLFLLETCIRSKQNTGLASGWVMPLVMRRLAENNDIPEEMRQDILRVTSLPRQQLKTLIEKNQFKKPTSDVNFGIPCEQKSQPGNQKKRKRKEEPRKRTSDQQGLSGVIQLSFGSENEENKIKGPKKRVKLAPGM